MTLLIFCSQAFAQSTYYGASKGLCRSNLDELRQDIIHILRMTPAMPPLAKLYGPLRRILDASEADYDQGNYSRCVSETARALRVTKQYR